MSTMNYDADALQRAAERVRQSESHYPYQDEDAPPRCSPAPTVSFMLDALVEDAIHEYLAGRTRSLREAFLADVAAAGTPPEQPEGTA